MEEREILTRLGFEADTDEEVKKAEKDLASVDQLKYYDLTYKKENYFQLEDKKLSDISSDESVVYVTQPNQSIEQIIKSFLSKNSIILPIFNYAYGRIMITGWRTCLYNGQIKIVGDSNSHDESWIKIRQKLESTCISEKSTTVENTDKNEDSTSAKGTGSSKNAITAKNIDNIMDKVVLQPKVSQNDSKAHKSNDEKNAQNDDEEGNLAELYYINKGHILGKFTNLDTLINAVLRNNQNVDNINTYPQFDDANQKNETDKDYGQWHFEKEALDHLPCYYEAEAIFRDWNDRIPIGTRIRIIKIKQEKKKDGSNVNSYHEIEHVFIPNCLHSESVTDKCKQSYDNKGETTDVALKYREFFKYGNIEKLFSELGIDKGTGKLSAN